jgi:hypothetical protein
MTLGVKDKHRRSRDHILPHRDGHRVWIYGDTYNIRIVCQRCNNLLSKLDQCPGAVVCYLAAKKPAPSLTRVRLGSGKSPHHKLAGCAL